MPQNPVLLSHLLNNKQLFELWLAPALKTARTIFLLCLHPGHRCADFSYSLPPATAALPVTTAARALLAPASAPPASTTPNLPQ